MTALLARLLRFIGLRRLADRISPTGSGGPGPNPPPNEQ
jgi:hypothetical protein